MLHAPPEDRQPGPPAVPLTARVLEWTPDLRQRLPHAAQAVLVALLMLQAARLAWLILVPPAPVGVAQPAAAASVASRAAPAGFDPFFPAATEAAVAVEASSILLFGIRVGADGGSAILGESGGPQGTYRPGESIKQGLSLSSIAADHVVLESQGRRIRLEFADAAGSAALPSTAALPTALPPASNAATPAAVDPQRLLAEAGLQPRLQDGKPNGYTLIPRGDGAALRQAGLQAGDVLLSINGQALTAERYSALAEELAGQTRLDITFERGTETRTLSLQANTP